jgi:hypothetical protein
VNIEICPTDENFGVEKTGLVLFSNQHGDAGQIVVTQNAAAIPPPAVIFNVIVALSPLDLSGLIILYPYGYATVGSASVNITFVPFSPAHASGDPFTMYWLATKNGSFAGYGSFTAYDEGYQ